MELVLQDDQTRLNISDSVFACKFNEALIHQVAVAYLAGGRQGTRAQKSRSEVSGSGRKPWRQKGTGRARAGCSRSPIWRSGGVSFAAKPRNYMQKVNKKMYRSAIKGILSKLVSQNRILCVRSMRIEFPKTKLLLNKLRSMTLKYALIVTDKLDRNLFLASRNLYKVDVCDVFSINPINLISFEKIIFTVDAVKLIEERLK